uniref:Uncharacterized protein n=1 Tax=Candidatus Kentrum sp. TUN TaxID=2126343 RepID=A0A450ZZ19_9GAMM|nr:MAG: hypothetical protein BECKTUN1418D_GA0071000_109419 [Candidatus Kentron sp. TUN]
MENVSASKSHSLFSLGEIMLPWGKIPESYAFSCAGVETVCYLGIGKTKILENRCVYRRLTPCQPWREALTCSTDSMPRSLQISFARISGISECLGIAERLLRVGLCHQECLPPSLSKTHPRSRRCLSKALLFMRQWRFYLPGNRCPPGSAPPHG